VFANVALHGLEAAITRACPGRGRPAVVRYADALIGLPPPRAGLERGQTVLAEPGHGMGLEWHPRATRITHPWQVEQGEAGFDCLGFNRRHSPTPSKRGDKTRITPSREAMARPPRQIGAGVRRQRRDAQGRLLAALTPVIRGWRHSCSTGCRHETFEPMAAHPRPHLRSWIRCRPPHTRLQWGDQPYGRCADGPRHFRPRARGKRWGCPHRDAESAARARARAAQPLRGRCTRLGS
jgi:RNA-directed DNA polymerase